MGKTKWKKNELILSIQLNGWHLFFLIIWTIWNLDNEGINCPAADCNVCIVQGILSLLIFIFCQS